MFFDVNGFFLVVLKDLVFELVVVDWDILWFVKLGFRVWGCDLGWGGVILGVGGLCWFGGVVGVWWIEMVGVWIFELLFFVGFGGRVEWVLEEVCDCVGGVGGRVLLEFIFLVICLRVWGLEGCELEEFGCCLLWRLRVCIWGSLLVEGVVCGCGRVLCFLKCSCVVVGLLR